jgi:hypothetical protein
MEGDTSRKATLLDWRKHKWSSLLHFLARPVNFAVPLIDSHRYHLPVSPIRVRQHHAVERLRQVFHHVGADDWRAGEEQAFTPLCAAHWGFLLLRSGA